MIQFLKRFFLDETAFIGVVRGALLVLGGLAVSDELPAEIPKWLGVVAMGAAGMIRSSSTPAKASPATPAAIAKLGLVLLLVVSLGCAAQVTGDGMQWSFGQAQATTCDTQSTTEDTDAGTDCSTASGGPVSDQGASLLSPLFLLLGGIGKVLTGVGGG